MNATPVTKETKGGGTGTKGSKEANSNTNSNQLINFSHGVQ